MAPGQVGRRHVHAHARMLEWQAYARTSVPPAARALASATLPPGAAAAGCPQRRGDETRRTPLEARVRSRVRERPAALARHVPTVGDGGPHDAADDAACGRRRRRSCGSADIDPVTDFLTGEVITVGADCALPLDYLAVEYKHKFAADSNVTKVQHSKFGKDSLQ